MKRNQEAERNHGAQVGRTDASAGDAEYAAHAGRIHADHLGPGLGAPNMAIKGPTASGMDC
jgi:hypothetical protein